MNDKNEVPLQAAPHKRFYREDIIAILLIAGVLTALMAVFANYCLHTPRSKVTRSEAVILFEQYFQETEEVLRSYGITGELKNPDFTEEESTLWYQQEDGNVGYPWKNNGAWILIPWKIQGLYK